VLRFNCMGTRKGPRGGRNSIPSFLPKFLGGSQLPPLANFYLVLSVYFRFLHNLSSSENIPRCMVIIKCTAKQREESSTMPVVSSHRFPLFINTARKNHPHTVLFCYRSLSSTIICTLA